MTHELKTWPVPFEAVASGFKHHEVRRPDRDFHVGDRLLLREWRPDTGEYTGRELIVGVSYMTRAGEWGLPDDVCVMSIEVLK